MLFLFDVRQFFLESFDVLEASVDTCEPDVCHFIDGCQAFHDMFANLDRLDLIGTARVEFLLDVRDK